MKTSKRLLITFSALLLATLAMGMPTKVFADNLPVSSNDDSGNGTLRTAIKDACEDFQQNPDDDTLSFAQWSPSFPSGGNHVILLKSPLVIPSDCKGKVSIMGQDAQDGVTVTLDASALGSNECALTVASSGNHIQNLNVINAKGKGICVTGNDNNLANIRAGFNPVKKTVGGNRIGIELAGDNNILFKGNQGFNHGAMVLASSETGILISGSNNKVRSYYIGTTPENEANPNPSVNFANTGDGVKITGDANQIGGSNQFKNVIARNGGTGIVVDGTDADQNDLSFNEIFKNGKLGIDLNDDDVTENGSCDSLANDCFWFPYDLIAIPINLNANKFGIQGTAPAGSLVLIYYIGDEDDTHGEGQKLLSTVNVAPGNFNNPDDDRFFSHTISGNPDLVPGARIAMMACVEQGNNRTCSEFSGSIELPSEPPCGNGVVDLYEECDPQDSATGADCDNFCRLNDSATPSPTPTATPTATPTLLPRTNMLNTPAAF